MRTACNKTPAHHQGYRDYETDKGCDFEPNTQEHKDWVDGFNERHSEMFAHSEFKRLAQHPIS